MRGVALRLGSYVLEKQAGPALTVVQRYETLSLGLGIETERPCVGGSL